MVNVTIYSIHGSYGYGKSDGKSKKTESMDFHTLFGKLEKIQQEWSFQDAG